MIEGEDKKADNISHLVKSLLEVAISDPSALQEATPKTVHLLICTTSGIPETVMASFNEQKIIEALRDFSAGASSRSDWDGKCVHTGKHFSEALHFFAYHKTEYRVDCVGLS
jgi:hypothetical protein